MKKTIIAIVVILILVLAGYFGYIKLFKKNETGKILSIPEEILSNKFGFLSYSPDEDAETINSYGGAWARSHPGPFSISEALHRKGTILYPANH